MKKPRSYRFLWGRFSAPIPTHPKKLNPNPFHTKFKTYWDIHPNPFQSWKCFYLYRVKTLAGLLSNASKFSHISHSLLYSWDIALLLCCLYNVFMKIQYLSYRLRLWPTPNPNQSITFSQNVPHFHPFPIHIHFHMDFHSTEGLYSQLQDESGPRRIDQGPEGRIRARRTNQGPRRMNQESGRTSPQDEARTAG